MTRGGYRPGAGRPPQGDGRQSHLHVRIPAAKLQAYREAAARAGLSLTEWLETALDFKVLHEIDKVC